jgi:hypothetical protein
MPPSSTSFIRKFAGPGIIAATTLAMLLWSWGTWPDPLVDFGAQLYVPWQISAGHVLYRDIAYYNGPLSSYLNATAFHLFGVGLNTLVWLNLLIMAATMTVAYRLTVRVSGRWAAFMAGLTFALIFAFSQVVRLGNYNWLTPYTHEITHGTALGLAAIAAVARYQRTVKLRWISVAGGLLGAVFLTKAEPTAATFAAVAAQLAGGWWVARSSIKTITTALTLLIVFALLAPLVPRRTGLMALGDGSPNHVAAFLPRSGGAQRSSRRYHHNARVGGHLRDCDRWGSRAWIVMPITTSAQRRVGQCVPVLRGNHQIYIL